MASPDGYPSDTGDHDDALTDVVTEFPTIVSEDVTKQYVRLVASVFVAIGVGLAIPYTLFSVLGLTDALTGNGGAISGAAILSLFGIVPFFGSLLVAVGMGIFVGAQLEDRRFAIVASGVGSYLGAVGLVLPLVLSAQLVGSGAATSLLGLQIDSLLQELIVAGVGIGIAGAGAGYVGHEMRETLRADRRAPGTDADGLDGLIATVKDLPSSVTEPPTRSGIKLSVYAFGVMGVGYGVTVILLGWIATDVIAVSLTLVASYAVVFSAPFLAVYLGVKIGRISDARHAVAAGSVGSFAGFVVLILVMTVLGSFGPSPSVVDGITSASGALQGDTQGAGSGLLMGAIGMIPFGYEVQYVTVVGGISSGVAGGLAGFSVNDYARW